jgi:deoxyribonuclease-4
MRSKPATHPQLPHRSNRRSTLVYGSHLSIAGGMVNALEQARRYKFDCVQGFTKNQRQWRVPVLRDDERDAWLNALREMKWDASRGPDRVVSHASYLINLASPVEQTWRASVELFQHELARCAELKIPLCVVHPGAHLGDAPDPAHQARRDPMKHGGSFTSDEKRGMLRVAAALNEIHEKLPAADVVTCLETTVGAGTTLGSTFEQLAFMRAHVHQPERVAFCFDTCHVTAAGYDMTTPGSAQRVLRRFGSVCGTKLLRVVHVNDSMFPVGSRRDRHAHVGAGCCGRSCFSAILHAPGLSRVPKILETPKGDNDKGTPWDLLNVRRLKRLARSNAASR